MRRPRSWGVPVFKRSVSLRVYGVDGDEFVAGKVYWNRTLFTVHVLVSAASNHSTWKWLFVAKLELEQPRGYNAWLLFIVNSYLYRNRYQYSCEVERAARLCSVLDYSTGAAHSDTRYQLFDKNWWMKSFVRRKSLSEFRPFVYALEFRALRDTRRL